MTDRWDLSYLYKGFDDEAFLRDLSSLPEEAKGLSALVADETLSPKERLLSAVEKSEALSRKADALSNYIQCTLAVDAENAAANAAEDRLMAAWTEVSLASSAMIRLIAGILDLEAVIAGSETLKNVAFALREMREEAKHLIDEKVEPWILEMQLSGGNAFSQLRDKLDSTLLVEFRGEKLPLSAVRGKAYDRDPSVRKDAYEAELAAYPKIELPMGYCLNSIKMEARTLAKARGYDSVLEMTLADSRMDRETLEAMFTAVREALPDFRCYLRAKGKYLGHPDGLPFYDLFAPVGENTKTYTAEEARSLLLKEMKEFTPDMAAFIDHAFEHGWIDLYPRPGKTGGAFCSSVHFADRSLVMSNFQGSFSDVSTLAHELGHAWHNRCLAGLPYLLIDTPMPLAETASIFNETLLSWQVRQSASPEEQLTLLESGIMEATQTVVDIYSRFLFETRVVDTRADHAMNVEELKEAMLWAQEESYGDGLAKEARHPYMWACKSHYYSSGYNFYNFPYCFGLLFGKGVFARWQKEGSAFVPEYCRMLRLCGSAAVADVAKSVGIDVRDTSFWRESLSVVRREIDEFCRLADQGGTI
ncbi:MAG: M3 family oligoendopeptidase [Clostridiales bacterium]|nr:M3 family oligoendopeptidase [Clostridiales bacterium]